MNKEKIDTEGAQAELCDALRSALLETERGLAHQWHEPQAAGDIYAAGVIARLVPGQRKPPKRPQPTRKQEPALFLWTAGVNRCFPRCRLKGFRMNLKTC